VWPLAAVQISKPLPALVASTALPQVRCQVANWS
jgi:hypothetical protein